MLCVLIMKCVSKLALLAKAAQKIRIWKCQQAYALKKLLAKIRQQTILCACVVSIGFCLQYVCVGRNCFLNSLPMSRC